MIDIIELNKSFGTENVLKQITLNFKKGNIYGFAGRNGAGKTTLFNCIAGLENFKGKITYSEGILKNNLSYLPTDLYYFNNITGNEFLKFMSMARNKFFLDFSDKNIFDLPLNKYISEYSTGMKKKITLMGILLQQSNIIVLDEPFNGVDLESNEIISEILLELRKLNKIVILSSHIFSTLTDVCDKIILIESGAIKKIVMPNEYDTLKSEFNSDQDRKISIIRNYL